MAASEDIRKPCRVAWELEEAEVPVMFHRRRQSKYSRRETTSLIEEMARLLCRPVQEHEEGLTTLKNTSLGGLAQWIQG